MLALEAEGFLPRQVIEPRKLEVPALSLQRR
jgi:hypothetical protein